MVQAPAFLANTVKTCLHRNKLEDANRLLDIVFTHGVPMGTMPQQLMPLFTVMTKLQMIICCEDSPDTWIDPEGMAERLRVQVNDLLDDVIDKKE